MGDAFDQLASFSVVTENLQESRLSPDRLYSLVDRVNRVLDSLWEMLPPEEVRASDSE